MKHIMPYNLLSESNKSKEDVAEIINDVFIDWIDEKDLFDTQKIRINGYKSELESNITSSEAKLGNYIVYEYCLFLKKMIDQQDVLYKIKRLKNIGFKINYYHSECKNTLSNGIQKEETIIKIHFSHPKYKISEKEKYKEIFKKIEEIGFEMSKTHKGPKTWYFEKEIIIDDYKNFKIKPEWFKINGGKVKEEFKKRLISKYSDEYKDIIQNEVNKINKKLPEMKLTENNIRTNLTTSHTYYENNEIRIGAHFELKIGKDKTSTYVTIIIVDKNLN